MQLRETQNQINHRFTFTTGAITQEIELWFYVQSSTVSSSRNDLYWTIDQTTKEVRI